MKVGSEDPRRSQSRDDQEKGYYDRGNSHAKTLILDTWFVTRKKKKKMTYVITTL